jgi:hypothetical protein
MSKMTDGATRFASLKAGLYVAAAAAVLMAGFDCRAEPAAGTEVHLHSPWIACSELEHVAYRVVPPALNPHNAFTHPVKVSLKPGQSCADLK